MKRGFTLLETIVAITFLAVSLLMLYGNFSNMINNSRNNVYFDNVSDIYKVYYLKEYLDVFGLYDLEISSDIKKISCNDFKAQDCDKLVNSLKIKNLYVAKYDLKHTDISGYSKRFNDYVNTLSNKGDFKYRFIVEFQNTSYASMGLGGDFND